MRVELNKRELKLPQWSNASICNVLRSVSQVFPQWKHAKCDTQDGLCKPCPNPGFSEEQHQAACSLCWLLLSMLEGGLS